MSATIDHARIAALIPHAGTMCLLDSVLHWDGTGIRCSARNHHDPANPLRGPQGLGMLAGIEYCAQAMAVHGALLAEAVGERLAPGYLAAVRGVRLQGERLDTVPGPLLAEARRLMGQGGLLMYEVALYDGDERLLLEGRITVAERGGETA